METRRTGLQAEVFAEVAAHAFAEELFPTVTIFRHRRIGVGLLESSHIGVALFVSVIDASGRGVEKALHASGPGRHQEMGVDEHGKHAQRAIVLDESHPAHVGGKIINDASIFERLFASFPPLEIQHKVFDARQNLVPLSEGFDINGSKIGKTLALKVSDQMAPDKSAASTDHNFIRFHNKERNLAEGGWKSTEILTCDFLRFFKRPLIHAAGQFNSAPVR